MDATGDEIVASTLRRWFGENRRLDLEEAKRVEVPTRRLHETVAQDDVPLQLGATQIEVTVSQAQLLSRQHLALATRDRNGRRHRRAHDAQGRCADFDIAGGKLRIAHALGPRNDLALDEYDSLCPERRRRVDHLLRSRARVKRDLHEAGAVAQIDEDDSAKRAPPVHPASKPHPHTRVLGSERPREMRSVSHGVGMLDSHWAVSTRRTRKATSVPAEAPSTSAIQSAIEGSRAKNC